MDQVLNTTELLEAILGRLSHRDLLLSQRVSHKFRNTIKGSIQLQRALFLAPEVEQSPPEPFISNPIFEELKVRRFTALYFAMENTYLGLYSQHLAQGFDAKNRNWNVLKWDVEVRDMYSPPIAGYKVCPSGSWEKMYLTQPPGKVNIYVRGAGRLGRIVGTKAETLGEMLRAVYAEVMVAWAAENRTMGRRYALGSRSLLIEDEPWGW